jgi:tRNA/rRNA methyltransferase
VKPDADIAFVLSRTCGAGNVGAAARALKNMGFADLRLAAPAAAPRARPALAMAVHGRDVLQRAAIHRTLAAALSDRTIVFGTTCRTGPYRRGTLALRDGAREIAALAAANRIAIVFGPEDTGLTNRELKHCQRLLTIPTAPDYPSLNLAQAVMLTAYEIRLALGGARAASAEPSVARAPAGEVDAMLARLQDALIAIGFLPEDNPDHIMFALRAILGRGGLDARELDILSGIARQMRWAAEGGHATLERKRRAGRRLR